MQKADNHYGMTVNNQEEADFFLNSLKITDLVLEFGSGASTLSIAERVAQVHSIEHHPAFYEEVKAKLPANAEVYLVPQNAEPASGDDGSAADFQDYIQKAIELSDKHGKFDVIFIDGRARVACAAICHLIGHKNTIVFVHDYDHPNEQYKRREYLPIEEQHLNRLDGEFTMWRFNIKAFDEQRLLDEAGMEKETKAPGKTSVSGIQGSGRRTPVIKTAKGSDKGKKSDTPKTVKKK